MGEVNKMSDLKGIEVHDLLGLSEPATKLIETISSGIGKVYEPRYIKRMAKAKKEELEIISNAFNNNLNLPTKYENGNVTIDATDANELIKRAQNRFLFQQMKKQQNIDSVIGIAYSRLERVASVSNIPVDSDWISEFFDNVANISNEKMQILWGKILAGEVENPGQYSKRTLNGLKQLTQHEASVFQKVVPYILSCPGDTEHSYDDYFLFEKYETGLLAKYNIPFKNIMLLSEAGLLCENSQITISFEIKAGEFQLIKGINKAIKLENASTDNNVLRVKHPAYFLTEVGKQLLPILLEDSSKELSNEYLSDCLEEIKDNGIEFVSPVSPSSNVVFAIVDF